MAVGRRSRASGLAALGWYTLASPALEQGVCINAGLLGSSTTTIQALSSWDYREERIRPDRSDPADPVDGAGRPRSARAVLQYLAGALHDRDGATLTLADLYARRPLPEAD